MKLSFLPLAIAACMVASPAVAYRGLSVDAGTTGFGLHLSVPLQEKLSLRFGTNYAKLNHSGSTEDSDYDYTIRLRSHDFLLDWFPGKGGFRITGGVAYNGNELRTNTVPRNGTYTIGGATYQASEAGSIRGDVSFRQYAPYLGIGWGSTLDTKRRWWISADLGVLFQGSPRTELTSEGCRNSLFLNCSQLERDVEREEAELNRELEDFRYFPVIRFGLNYRF